MCVITLISSPVSRRPAALTTGRSSDHCFQPAADLSGWSVAVDGDSVVVGAWCDDDNGSDSGSAYVFTKPSSGGWATATETAKLTASDRATNDEIGNSVAADGDRRLYSQSAPFGEIRARLEGTILVGKVWTVQDSNLRPPACKAGALTS